MDTAKIFWSGRSQAVRLPKSFRFDADEVKIRRQGNAIILEPISDSWAWLDDICQKVDEDFVQAVNEPVADQDRPSLDKLFE